MEKKQYQSESETNHEFQLNYRKKRMSIVTKQFEIDGLEMKKLVELNNFRQINVQ